MLTRMQLALTGNRKNVLLALPTESVTHQRAVVVWLFIGTRKRLVALHSVPKAHEETHILPAQCNLST